MKQALAAAACALLLQACIVVPQTRDYYDAGCQMMSKEIVLGATMIGRFQGCAGEACAVMLATMGAVTAATAVVSGSIALVGNVAYWVERQGRCMR
jgi:hypothetical protein